MSNFRFEVPGQPLSWNRSYRQRVVDVKDKWGRPVIGNTGKPKRRPDQYKTPDAVAFQKLVMDLAKQAKPSGFTPAQIIVAYDFTLQRDIDCDNVMKMTNDAIARALGLDDRYFYPVVLSKTTGSKDPKMLIQIFDRSAWRVEINAQ